MNIREEHTRVRVRVRSRRVVPQHVHPRVQHEVHDDDAEHDAGERFRHGLDGRRAGLAAAPELVALVQHVLSVVVAPLGRDVRDEDLLALCDVPAGLAAEEVRVGDGLAGRVLHRVDFLLLVGERRLFSTSIRIHQLLLFAEKHLSSDCIFEILLLLLLLLNFLLRCC